MAKVSVSEAARLAGVSRQHFYKKYIDQGIISIEKDGDKPPVVDTSELLRVFGTLHVDSQVDSQQIQQLTPTIDSDVKVLEIELKAAREALRDKEDQLREAKEREDWLKKQVEELTGTIKLIEHKPDTQPDPLQAATIAARLQELENDARQFKENEDKLLERTAQLDAERKELRSQLLQEKTKSWWQKLRGQ